jgi:hypothetical protein
MSSKNDNEKEKESKWKRLMNETRRTYERIVSDEE